MSMASLLHPCSPAGQADLFGEAILPGLSYREQLVSEAEEGALIARIDSANLTPFRFQQWTGKRLTHSFGWSYDFETGRFAPTDPIPGWLMPLKARAACFAGLEPQVLVQALLIRYDPGAGIGWHRDRPVFEHVIGISLGEPATMRFRRRTGTKFERASAPLAARSIYHLCGEARHGWEHSIAEMEVPRWSITFRSLADNSMRQAQSSRQDESCPTHAPLY
jgi:alkylated DNA repair dioxygenase AlkB